MPGIEEGAVLEVAFEGGWPSFCAPAARIPSNMAFISSACPLSPLAACCRERTSLLLLIEGSVANKARPC